MASTSRDVFIVQFLEFLSSPDGETARRVLFRVIPKEILDKVIDENALMTPVSKILFYEELDKARKHLAVDDPTFPTAVEKVFKGHEKIAEYWKVHDTPEAFYSLLRKCYAALGSSGLRTFATAVFPQMYDGTLLKNIRPSENLCRFEGVDYVDQGELFGVPDNITDAEENEIELAAASILWVNKREEVVPDLNRMLSPYGLELDLAQWFAVWSDKEKFELAEIRFISEHADFSAYYKSLLSNEKYAKGPLDDSLATALENEKLKRAEEEEGKKGKGGGETEKPLKQVDPSKIGKTYEGRFKELYKMPILLRVDIAGTKFEVLDWKCNCDGVKSFIRVNDLAMDQMKDIALGVIVTKLTEEGALEVNSDRVLPDETPEKAADFGLISVSLIRRWEPLAKSMMLAALHEFSQPGMDNSVRWFNSFSAVYGSFITEKKFVDLIKAIQQSDSIRDICKLMTVGDVRSSNNVLKYRLMRLSTPALIGMALRLVKGTEILRYVDPVSVRSYKAFHKAGILAQIAAGPLKIFLTGNINPVEYESIPAETKLCELAAIDAAPYDDKLIRQAKIVLESYGIEHGRWYQGERAMQGASDKDRLFKTVVKMVQSRERELMEKMANERAPGAEIKDWGDDANFAAVTKELDAWF